MQSEFPTLNLEALKNLYHKEAENLKAALLNGDSWQDLQEQRHKVVDIEAALYQAWRTANPAEFNNRDMGNGFSL